MKKNVGTKRMLFEMMQKVNSDFVLKEEYVAEEVFFNEDEKSSYPADLINDITVTLGNKPALSPQDIQMIATSHNITPEEVTQAMDYVLSTKAEKGAGEESLPANSQEAEEINDFFKFLENNPQISSFASVQYASLLDRYLAKPKQNPMVGKFIKITKYNFEWEQTYAKEIEKVNPNWEIQKRSGTYTPVEGFSVVKRDKSGDEVFDIVPRNPRSLILVLDSPNGEVVDKIRSSELQEKYGQYFTPSFFTTSSTGASGVMFRALKVYAVKRLAAGGKEWINPKFKYAKYSEYFNEIPTE